MDIEIVPRTPDEWLARWRNVSLRPDWEIVDRKGNGFLFRGTYLHVDFDEQQNVYVDDSPVLAVLATVDRYDNEKWAHISYTATDRNGPRPPNPKEAGMVRTIFGAGKGRIGPPREWVDTYGNPLMRNYWIPIDRKEKRP